MLKGEWSRGCRRVALWGLALCLVGLLSGCGPRAPKPIVQQALAYELAHLPPPVGSLVGSEQLSSHLQLQAVNIRRDRREPLLLASGETVEGHHLSGTYTLTIQLPGSRRPYRRKGDPFQLTLVRVQEHAPDHNSEPPSSRWLLAHFNPDSRRWQTLDFLPPSLPPAESRSTQDPEPVSPAAG